MSLYYIASEENQAYLAHHGVRGMKWGVRRNNQFYNAKSYDRAVRKGMRARLMPGESRQDRIKAEYINKGGSAKNFEGASLNYGRRVGKNNFIRGLVTAGVGSGALLASKAVKNDKAKAALIGGGAGAMLGGGLSAAYGAAINRKYNKALKKYNTENGRR